MAEDNSQNRNNDNTGDNNQNGDDKNKGLTPDVQKLVEEQVSAQLKDIKANLDKAYGTRDEALKKIAEFERKEKEAELVKLREEGKHKEAFEREIAEERAKREAAEKRAIELSRDVDIKSALSGLPFRNEKAAEIAFKELSGQFIQDEKGIWIHKSGISIKEAVDKFAKDEEQSFLFKPKVNSGSGSGASDDKSDNTNNSDGKRSLFKMSQADVLKLAAAGKL